MKYPEPASKTATTHRQRGESSLPVGNKSAINRIGTMTSSQIHSPNQAPHKESADTLVRSAPGCGKYGSKGRTTKKASGKNNSNQPIVLRGWREMI